MLLHTDARTKPATQAPGELFTAQATGGPWLPRMHGYLSCKTACEFVLALILVVLAGPCILLAALLVKLTSTGPAFYWQTRLGKHGRPYWICKLRTMFHDCELLTGPRWASANDLRITPLGRFLRRTHLDELPQMWNVLKGEMSLVGPRPERPEFFPHLERAIPGYEIRLRVRPGMTGLAQVQLPPDTDLASVRKKLAYDLYYVQHLGLGLDLCILLGTALYLVGVPLQWVPRYVRVPGGEVVERPYETWALEAEGFPSCEPGLTVLWSH